VDEAFEYLINKSSKGEKGQYFTPRYVIDMCVKMLNPQEHETMIDTAAGSCGFPVHSIFHVWGKIYDDLKLPRSHQFTTEIKPPRCVDYVQDKVFAIDFDEKAVRVGRTLNLIAGDGQTNVLHLNTLDYERWDEKTTDQEWTDIYGEGWKKLRKMRASKEQNRDFTFDILMANPPFAGDIKETRILAKYELARTVSLDKINKVDANDKNIEDATQRQPTFPEFLRVSHETIYKMADGTFRKVKVKDQNTVGRDILFIERNLNFIKPGGRMAIVLPQGVFDLISTLGVRQYISEHCRILAVVSLHGNVFKPHTNTKTSVLFVQKWHNELCPTVDNYPIFFATMKEPSKNNSGDKIYVENTDGTPALDDQEHLIVKHDLFDHNGKTKDGIAEAFIAFAKEEGLSFFLNEEKAPLALGGGIAFSVKKFRESFAETGRLDADYYQPKYEELRRKIELTGNAYRLGDLLLFARRGKQPVYADTGLPVINSKHVRDGLVQIDETNRFATNDDDELTIREGDVLINGTGVGTIGRCAPYLEKFPALPDNHVTILRCRLDIVNPIYLSVQLASIIGKMQTEQRSKGSSGQIELYPSDIEQFTIFLPSLDKQNVISRKLLEAHQARQRALALVAEATRAVEIAIEQDETAGMAYIEANS